MTGSGQVISGGSATVTGGIGVGALGVLLHPRQHINASRMRRNVIDYGRGNETIGPSNEYRRQHDARCLSWKRFLGASARSAQPQLVVQSFQPSYESARSLFIHSVSVLVRTFHRSNTAMRVNIIRLILLTAAFGTLFQHVSANSANAANSSEPISLLLLGASLIVATRPAP